MKWLILFLPVLAFASDDERGPNVDVDVKTITKTSVATGDVSTGDMNVENTLMGSNSDWPVMKRAVAALDELGVANEARVISAHRKGARLTWRDTSYATKPAG